MPCGSTGPGLTKPGAQVPISGSTHDAGSGTGSTAAAPGRSAATRPTAAATVPSARRIAPLRAQRRRRVEEGLGHVVAHAAVEREDLLVLAGHGAVLGDDVALGVVLEALDDVAEGVVGLAEDHGDGHVVGALLHDLGHVGE